MFQADSVICANSNYTLNDFLGLDKYEGGYDWVGAPWPWIQQQYYGGNGGFSLRRRSTMLDITRTFGDTWDGAAEVMLRP